MEKKEKKRYIGLSSTDALTGILNRRAFQVELEEQIRKKEPGFFIFMPETLHQSNAGMFPGRKYT